MSGDSLNLNPCTLMKYQTNSDAKIEFSPDPKIMYNFFKNDEGNLVLLHGHQKCPEILNTTAMQQPSYLKEQITNLTNCISRMEMILPNNEGENICFNRKFQQIKLCLRYFRKPFQ